MFGVAGDGVPIVSVDVVFTVTVTLAVCADVAAAPVPVPDPAVAKPAVAVTVVVRLVANVVCAWPFVSVATVLAPRVPEEPAVAVSTPNVTRTPGRGLPPASITVAVNATRPPLDPSVEGEALNWTPPTAAAPISTLTALAPDTDVPPEIAPIVAVPDVPPATNRATARPETSVSASAGSMRPRFVVNVTCVPLCGALPEASMICAMICVVPLAGRAVVATVRVMLEPDGASSGTFSHAAVKSAATARRTPKAAA